MLIEYSRKLGVEIHVYDGNFYVSLADYEKLLNLKEKNSEENEGD